jgi:hypothetical protein
MMIAAHGLRWILTILFAVITAYGLYRAIRPGSAGRAPADRLSHVLHAVMGLAMLAMAWPWGMRLPATPQVALFTLAALWFLLTAVLPQGKPTYARTGGHPRLHGILHSVIMGAMAWMVAAMSNAMAPAHSGGSGGDMAGMPGMTMTASGGTATMSLHGAPRTVAGILTLFFLLTALWWLTRAFDTARLADPSLSGAVDDHAAEHRAYDAGCHGGMALGMAVMLLMMT